MSRKFPEDSAGWRTLALVYLGVLVGGVTRPFLWLVGGPFTWLALTASTLSQESAWGQFRTSPNHDTTVGDAGASIGPMQWHVQNEGILKAALGAIARGDADDWRLSSFWSGYAFAVELNRAAMHSGGWWLKLLAPWTFKDAAVRYIHTHGASSSGASWDRILTYYRSDIEVRAREAFVAWRLLTFVPSILLTAAVVRRIRKLPQPRMKR